MGERVYSHADDCSGAVKRPTTEITDNLSLPVYINMMLKYINSNNDAIPVEAHLHIHE